MTASKNSTTSKSDKFYEAIISSALMFRTRGTYGSFDKALTSLIKRKPIIETGCSKDVCEKHFRSALKVVDDALEFENSYIRKKKAWLYSSGWFDSTTIDEISRAMGQYLKKRNPEAPAIFIERCIGRIYYFYHLA